MKKILLMLSLIVLIAIPLLAGNFAHAESYYETDGLGLQIATDQTDYKAKDRIKITLTVTNKNSYTVDNVMVAAILPEDILLRSGTQTTSLPSLAPEESTTLTLTATLTDEAIAALSPQDEGEDNLLLFLIAGGAALIVICGVVAILWIRKGKFGKKIACLLLSFLFLFGCLPVNVLAQAVTGEGLYAETAIKVQDTTYTLRAKVSRTIPESTFPSNVYTVLFQKNDGTQTTHEVQILPIGEQATMPTQPVRLDAEFLGWYSDAEGSSSFDFSEPIDRDMTLWAKWQETSQNNLASSGSAVPSEFAIRSTCFQDGRATVTVSCAKASILRMQFVDENNRSIISAVSVYTPEFCSLTPIRFPVTQELPDHYLVICDLLDAEGNTLCNSLTDIKNSTDYELFSQQTVHDFEDRTVINFDEKDNINFGVLQKNVIIITSSDTANLFTLIREPIPNESDPDGKTNWREFYVFENPDSTVNALKSGDCIHILPSNHLIKIDEKSVEDGKVTLTASDDVELNDFYDVLNVQMDVSISEGEVISPPSVEQTPSTATPTVADSSDSFAIQNTPSQSEWDGAVTQTRNEIDVNKDISLTLGGEATIPFNDTVDILVTLAGTGTLSLEIIYDVRFFAKDYFFISAIASVNCDIKVGLEISTDNSDSIVGKNTPLTELKLGEVNIPTPIPGLMVTTYPSIPVELELSASITITFNAQMKNGFTYSNIDGKQNISSTEKSITVTAQGKATIKAGPKIEISVNFCKEVLKAALSLQAGIEATLEIDLFLVQEGNPEVKDMCTLCLNGTAEWFVELKAELTYEVVPALLEGSLAEWVILKLSGPFPISPDFYISLINSPDSVHGGQIRFGWGSCPNEMYRTTVLAIKSDETPEDGVNVTVRDFNGNEVASGQTPLEIYLYDGYYTAECDRENNHYENGFYVSGNASIVAVSLASVGSLTGKVISASNRNMPIAQANILIFQNSRFIKGLTADANGRYSLSLPEGEYEIAIDAPGYIRFVDNATVVGNTTLYMETALMIQGTLGNVGTVSGNVINTMNGQGEEGVLLSFAEHWNAATDSALIGVPVITNSQGDYTIDLPIGNYTVFAKKDGFIDSSFNIIVQEGVTDNQNGTISPVRAEGSGDDYLITLTWDVDPRDVDAHVYGTSDGENFHVYFNTKRFEKNGQIICELDYDDTTSYGPEHITLRTEANETYYFYLHHYAGNGSLANSGAQITVQKGNELIGSYNVPTDQGSDRYWNVFAIRDGRILLMNTITSSPNTEYANF